MSETDIKKLYAKSNSVCCFCNQFVAIDECDIALTKRKTVNVWHKKCLPVYRVLCGEEWIANECNIS